MNRFFILSLILAIWQPLCAQKFNTKFGQISKVDLQLEACPFDAQAGAMVLSDISEARLYAPRAGAELEIVLVRHVRIKIFDATGFDQADVRIPYFTGIQNQTVLSKIKAHTIVPNGSKYDKVEVDKKKFFYEKTNDYYSSVKFSFPQVDEGVIIEYEYRLSSKYLSVLKERPLQGKIPVRYVYYEAFVPGFFNCAVSVIGHDADRISFDESDNLQTEYNYTNIAYAFEGHNMPGIVSDDYGTGLENIRTKARIIIRSLQLPGKPVQDIFGDYFYFNDNLLESTKFSQLDQSYKYLEAMVGEVRRSENAKEDIGNFATYVRSHAKYNKDRYFFPDQNVRATSNGSPGNSASINMFLTLMLKHAGYMAEPVILGSRWHRKPHPFYPDYDDFDHLVTLVSIGKKEYILDATSGLPEGMPRVETFNGEGWVVSETKPRKIDLHALAEAHFYVKSYWDLHPGGRTKITSNLSCNYIGVYALTSREGYTASELHDWISKNSEGDLDSLHIKSEGYKMSAEIERSVDIPEKSVIYLNPFYYKLLEYDIFKKEDRVTPLEFPYLVNATQIIELRIPEGYVVESLPPSRKLTLEQDGMRITYLAEASEGVIRINVRFGMKEEFYLVEQYQEVRSFLSEVEAMFGKKIVLKHEE